MMFNPFETTTTEEATTGFDFAVPDVITPVTEENPFEIPTSGASPIIQPQQTNVVPQYNKKYNIVDMFWLINQKLFNQESLEKGEASLLIIGYNADFSNLRLSFHEANAKSFTETSIVKYEMKQLTTVNVFSETAQKILYDVQIKKYKDQISNFERIFTQYSGNNDWKPNVTQIELNIPSNIIIRTKHNNTVYSFTLLDWQIQAFLTSLKFMTDGSAWKASLSI